MRFHLTKAVKVFRKFTIKFRSRNLAQFKLVSSVYVFLSFLISFDFFLIFLIDENFTSRSEKKKIDESLIKLKRVMFSHIYIT